MTPQLSRTDLLATVADLADGIRATYPSPKSEQGWWDRVDLEARRMPSGRFGEGEAAAAMQVLLEPETGDVDPYMVLMLFYLCWVGLRHRRQLAEQRTLLALMQANVDTSGVGAYGGSAMLGNYEAELIRRENPFDDANLLDAFDLADRAVKEMDGLIAYQRSRRQVALELLEIYEFHDHERFEEVFRSAKADFDSERRLRGHGPTPQLGAEARMQEARFHSLPFYPQPFRADLRQAIRLVNEALLIDQAANDEDFENYRARILRCEVRLFLLRARTDLARAEDQVRTETRDLLAEEARKQDERLDEVRRESLQLVGLLAGVVGLVTSVFAATRDAEPQQAIVAGLMAAGAIGSFLLVFTLLQQKNQADNRRVALAALIVMILAGSAIAVWRLW